MIEPKPNKMALLKLHSCWLWKSINLEQIYIKVFIYVYIMLYYVIIIWIVATYMQFGICLFKVVMVVLGCVVWYAWCLQWKYHSYVIDLALVLLLSTLSLIHTLLCCSCCWLCIGKLPLCEDCTFVSIIFFLKKVFRIICYEFHLKWKFKKIFHYVYFWGATFLILM